MFCYIKINYVKIQYVILKYKFKKRLFAISIKLKLNLRKSHYSQLYFCYLRYSWLSVFFRNRALCASKALFSHIILCCLLLQPYYSNYKRSVFSSNGAKKKKDDKSLNVVLTKLYAQQPCAQYTCTVGRNYLRYTVRRIYIRVN